MHREHLDFAIQMANRAGLVMKKYFLADDIGHEWKSDNSPITFADKEINSFVIEEVKRAFPEYGVLGEEESYEDNRKMIWVVDPVDGTIPFSIGSPISTFAMALVDKTDGQPIVAVIYDPFLDELFSAVKGQGAFCNGVKIKTSENSDFSRGYFSVGASKVTTKNGINLPEGVFAGLVRRKGGRTMNYVSGSYMSTKLASGKIMGQLMGTLLPWDAAAAALIVREAGGIVTDVDGNSRRYDELGNGCILTANPKVHQQVLKMINDK